MNKSLFIVCSFYTLDTPYVEVAKKYLLTSLNKLIEIKFDIAAIPNLGSWQKNTCYKPKFIKQMLKTHKENIVMVDCDAEILQYPTLFENIPLEYNVGCHILDREKWYNKKINPSKEFLTGTMFWRNNQRSKNILDMWDERINGYSKDIMVEQKSLPIILKEMNEPIFELPLSYCYIKTLPNGRIPHIKIENPIIAHNQISRLHKRHLNK